MQVMFNVKLHKIVALALLGGYKGVKGAGITVWAYSCYAC
jgi:hypothetical protein